MHHRSLHVLWLCLCAACAAWALQLLASPAAVAQDGPEKMGKWSAVITGWRNVPIHASLLPNGKVLFWGRRETGNPDLDVETSTPWIWDPETNSFAQTGNLPGYNLFCSGHTFMVDGKLFVAGGHQGGDGQGEPLASTYDYDADKWEPILPMEEGGRWYPTATTLPDGGILVSVGTNEDTADNKTQEIWKNGAWQRIVGFEFPDDAEMIPPYYPRMHVIPDGNVFMTGPLALTQILDPDAVVPSRPLPGKWMFLRPDLGHAGSERQNKGKEYAASVMYDVGKIIYIGGGNPPSAACEIVDVTAADRQWMPAASMTLPRRQHNATLLPDGTVLVTGGTKGDGDPHLNPPPNAPVPAGPGVKFNDLRPGQPLRSAELWDPKKGVMGRGEWTRLAKASVDRCYHSVALLLPDATVLSAGGGEYRPYDIFHGNKNPNHSSDTHADAQIFSPPYLFAADGSPAPRPVITTAPGETQYGVNFTVTTPDAASIKAVNLVRLGSVTHSWDAGQRINSLKFAQNGSGGLAVTAPANPNVCIPGYCMLFILNDKGVPSKATFIRIGP